MDDKSENILDWFLKPKKLVVLIGAFILLKYSFSGFVYVITDASTHSKLDGSIANMIYTAVCCAITILLFRYVRSIQIKYAGVPIKFIWKTGIGFWGYLILAVFIFYVYAVKLTAIQSGIKAINSISDFTTASLYLTLLLNLRHEHGRSEYSSFLVILCLLFVPHFITIVLNTIYENITHLNSMLSLNKAIILVNSFADSILFYTIGAFFCIKYRNQILRIIVSMLALYPLVVFIASLPYVEFYSKQVPILSYAQLSYGLLYLLAAAIFQFLIYRKLKVKGRKPVDEDNAIEAASQEVSQV